MSLAILCPGQGAQDPASFAALSSDPRARKIAAAFEAATGLAVGDLAGLTTTDLQRNAVAQPLVCATTLAAFAVLREVLPEPIVFAGYSVGELAAYGCAGWLTPEETIALAARRAAAMDAATVGPAAMAALRGLDRAAVDALLAGTNVHVAIVNGADRFVVAGAAAATAAVVARAEATGARATPLGVRVASHTPLLRAAAAAFDETLRRSGLGCSGTGARVIAGVDAAPVLTRRRAIATLSAQIASPVDWASCMTAVAEAGATVALELPPGADLSRLLRDVRPLPEARAAVEFRSPAGIAAWVRGKLG